MDRPVAAAGNFEGEAKRFAVWKDVIGLDSEYDYDPVWAKCLELNIAPSFHSGARRSGLRLSPSNFVYNHIGHFSAANHAACKAMFLGGVTRRFPGLNMAFLEGGAGWACPCTATCSAVGKSAASKASKRSTRAISTAPCCWTSPRNMVAKRSLLR
jgi:predicted TIM-barrel fold metal-dependent hydrolase